MGDLEHQLLRFPYGAHDDLIDAEQGLVQLLQYPKSPKKPTEQDDQFMRFRKMVMDKKNPAKRYGLRQTQMFGTRKRQLVPAEQALW